MKSSILSSAVVCYPRICTGVTWPLQDSFDLNKWISRDKVPTTISNSVNNFGYELIYVYRCLTSIPFHLHPQRTIWITLYVRLYTSWRIWHCVHSCTLHIHVSVGGRVFRYFSTFSLMNDVENVSSLVFGYGNPTKVWSETFKYLRHSRTNITTPCLSTFSH